MKQTIKLNNGGKGSLFGVELCVWSYFLNVKLNVSLKRTEDSCHVPAFRLSLSGIAVQRPGPLEQYVPVFQAPGGS
jgi:hypothetical protein